MTAWPAPFCWPPTCSTNVVLLGFASLIEKRGLELGDERSLRFTSGLTEGTETVIAYTAICLLPTHAGTIAWVFAGMVFFTVGQRIALAVSTLGDQAGRARITSDG